jgi:hypothetical protein
MLIKVILVWERFYLVLSQILNIKISSFIVLRRKEVKKIHLKCIGVNIGLLTFCTDSTDLLPASVYVVAVNCDLLGSLAPPHYYRLPSCSVLVPRT